MVENLTKKVQKYKLVFIGDQSVGKTCIINRFVQDVFVGTQQSTVGIDFVSKTLHFGNKTVRLQLWDTAGQERFRSLIPSYVRDSDAAIIVYDITNQNSYNNVEKWIDYVREERGNDVLIVLVGNKCDATDARQILTKEAQLQCEQQNIEFFETSAKEGTNIQHLFKSIAQILQNKENSSTVQEIQIDEAKPDKKIFLQTPQINNTNQTNKQNASKCQC